MAILHFLILLLSVAPGYAYEIYFTADNASSLSSDDRLGLISVEAKIKINADSITYCAIYASPAFPKKILINDALSLINSRVYKDNKEVGDFFRYSYSEFSFRYRLNYDESIDITTANLKTGSVNIMHFNLGENDYTTMFYGQGKLLARISPELALACQ